MMSNAFDQSVYQSAILSLTRKFEIETAKRYSVSLENAKGEGAVHIEEVLANAAELHVDFIIVVLVDQLEVLHAGLVHAPVEVQHECLHLLVPFRRLVEEEHYVRRVVVLELPLYCFGMRLCVRPEHFLTVLVYHRKKNFHSAGTFRSQDVCFVLDYSVLLPNFIFFSHFFWIFLVIENVEFCA